MIVRTQTVRFTPDRAPTPRKVKIGFEGDNMVERLCFKLPRIAENQTATMMLDGEYANMVILTEDEDRYYVDLTAELIGGDGEHEAYVVIDGGDTGEAWGSGTFALQVGEIPGFAGDISERFPDAIEQLRSEIAGHRAEMQETSEEIKAEADAARADAEAAQKAANDATESSGDAKSWARIAEAEASDAERHAKRAEQYRGDIYEVLKGGDDGQVLGKVDGEPTWIDPPEVGNGDVTTDALAAAIARHNASGGAHPDIRAAIDAMSGGTGGAVASVNGKTGAVVLTAADVGALAEDELQSAVDDALAQAKESGEFDGSAGIDGKDGKNGVDGSPGKDGVSVTHNWNGTTLTVTSASGTSSADLKGSKGDKGDKGDAGSVGLQGEKGETGATGPAGSDGIGIKSVAQTTTSSADGGSNVITVTKTDNTTSTFTVKNGRKGSTGPAGKTPVKGVDYFTAEDKAELTDIMTDTLREDAEFIAAVSEHAQLVKVAASPEFVNDISECTDTSKVYVLPNGHLCAYMQTEVTTEGETKPNFTNIFDTSKGAYIKDGHRYSHSGGSFSAEATTCAVVVPVPGGSWKVNQQYTLRVQGATVNGGTSRAKKIYVGNTSSDFTLPATNEAAVATQADGTVVFTHTPNANDNANTFSWLVFHVDDGVDASKLIVTFNEEISYTTTPGGTEIVTKWTDTGIEYNQPPDYAERVSALEGKTARLETDVDVLENRINNIGGSVGGSGGMEAFAYAAYPPSPQLPGDGSAEADFNTANVLTSEVYAYMDALWSRYRTYMVRQNLGKDASGQYDYYRYVFSKAYWRAWVKEGYPKMYAWKNGSTVIYSESVSPRVGDVMYSAAYIGAAYNTVAAVNSETIGVASTRTVNGLEFVRYMDGDVEPTVVYTVPLGFTNDYKGRTYTADFVASHRIVEFSHEYIVDSQGTRFDRYPFEDRKADKTRLFSVFILANEHGNHGDSMIPCVTVLRMLKDMCGNTDNLFMKWLKENAIVTVIPLGNPYGSYNNYTGVNINRNYDTPGWAGSDDDPAGGTKEDGDFGPYAGSEIETQYIMNTIQQCKAQAAMSCHGRGIPHNMLGEYNSAANYQGCGFDPERMYKVEEALYSAYNFGFAPNGQHLPADVGEDESYLNAGKSPSYIEYSGAVGGLIEIDDHEVGTLDRFTPLAMEQAYAEVLLVLQNWCEEALLKAQNE